LASSYLGGSCKKAQEVTKCSRATIHSALAALRTNRFLYLTAFDEKSRYRHSRPSVQQHFPVCKLRRLAVAQSDERDGLHERRG
jgi:Fe2+ or Zn2+ uptake regulation protein